MPSFSISRVRQEEGFTLIELLVVILIIGILAAIAIPSFLAQRERGQDTCAKSQTRTMATAMETYYTETNGYTANIASLGTIESAITGSGACGVGTQSFISSTTPTDGACGSDVNGTGSKTAYCVSQTSPSGASFAVYRAEGTAAVRTCGPSARGGKGACPATLTW